MSRTRRLIKRARIANWLLRLHTLDKRNEKLQWRKPLRTGIRLPFWCGLPLIITSSETLEMALGYYAESDS